MKLTVTPFPHQQEYIKFALLCDFTLCGDQMGLGKTLSAIGVSVAMDCPTLVVAPAFLKHNWKAEYLKFTDIKESEISIDKLTSKSKVVITSYSKLKSAAKYFKWADLVIADEAHYLKNIEAQRTKYFHQGIKNNKPSRLCLLSGTAVKNRVEEFYSLLVLLSYCPNNSNGKKIQDKFKTKYKFARHFSNERVFNIRKDGYSVEVRKFEGLRNEQELKTYFRGKYMRRMTSQVIDLPELRDRYVEVNYDYDDIELQLAYEKFTGKKDGHIMAIKKGSAVAKAPFTADYAKNIHSETGEPVVIFSDHIDPVHIIARKLGKKAAVITGATDMAERHRIVQAFQTGRLDYLVATIGAASTGLTLTASSNLIFNDMSYVPADNAQASKRIHRIGQEKLCTIHKICGSAIDKSIMNSLASKQATLDKIL